MCYECARIIEGTGELRLVTDTYRQYLQAGGDNISSPFVDNCLRVTHFETLHLKSPVPVILVLLTLQAGTQLLCGRNR